MLGVVCSDVMIGKYKIDEKFTGKLKSLTECMQQHEPTDLKIGQSADCMLCDVCVCVATRCTRRAQNEN